MQSSIRSSNVLPRGTKLSETRKFIDQFGTWVLAMALGVGGLIVAYWLIWLIWLVIGGATT